MKIISDTSIHSTAEKLHSAWSLDPTFAVVPRRSDFSEEELQSLLALVPEDLLQHHFILLTSGSTGKPKLIVGSKKRAIRLANVLEKVQKLEPVAQTIIVLPLSYSYALINQWVWATVHDRDMVLTQGFAYAGVLKKILKEARQAMLCLVGAQVPLFKRIFGETVQFPDIIRLNFAGGKFPQESLDYLFSIFPNAQIYNNYGCAEAMPRLTIRTDSASDSSNNIGKPLPGVELSTNSEGTLCFRSPYGAVGYIENGEFQRIQEDDWVQTGDLGFLREDSSWMLNGRAVEVFIRYGEKISLYTIDDSLKKQWWGESAYYQETDVNGELGYVAVVSPTLNKETSHAIMRQLRLDFPRTHWPLRLESVEEFPLLSNGKVDANKLSSITREKEIHWLQN